MKFCNENGVGFAVAPMTLLLYPLSGTADDGIMDTQMVCNFPQWKYCMGNWFVQVRTAVS
jgi:hypothetical protein